MPYVTDLFIPILFHVALGTLLSVIMAILGWPLASLCRQILPPGKEHLAIMFAFPFGVAITVLLGVIAGLVSPFAGVGAVIVLVLAAARMIYREKPLVHLAVRVILLSFPAILLFSVVSGVINKGPTSILPGAYYGDTIYYVARLESIIATGDLSQSLLVAGDRWLQSELLGQGVGLVALLFYHLPLFDPFLFFSVSVLVVGLQWTALFVAVALSRKDRLHDVVGNVGAIICLATIGHYAGWEVESITVSWALVLAFPLALLSVSEARSFAWAVVAIAIFLAMAALKTAATIFVVIALLYRAPEYLKWIIRKVDWKFQAIAIVIGLLGVSLVWDEFVSVVGTYSGLAPDWSLDYLLEIIGKTSHLYALMGALLLFVVLPLKEAILVASSVVLFVINPVLFYIQSSVVVSFAVARFWMAEQSSRVSIALLVLSGIGLFCFRISSMSAYADVTMLAKVLAFGLPLVSLLGWTTIRAVVSAGGVALFALKSVDAAHKYLNNGHLAYQDRQLWEQVRAMVPRDGLVFTSFTGHSPGLHEGWNSYAAIAHRQIFISGWYVTRIRFSPNALQVRLKENEEVLQGELRPSELEIARQYNSYYAVVNGNYPAQQNWKLLASTDAGKIYQIM